MKPALIVIVVLLYGALKGTCQDSALYVMDTTIALPGDNGYDYLFVDTGKQILYVSHGSSVHAVDLGTGRATGSVDSLAGCHGIAVAPETGLGFISEGRSNSITVFDLKTLNKVNTILLRGKKPDAILYDSYSKKIYAFNGDSENASVIDPVSLTETGTIALGGAPEFAVADGKGLLYNNSEDKNALKVIDTRTMKVTASYPLAPCGAPTGLAIDVQHHRLFTACRGNKGMSVVDSETGRVITTVPIGSGVDAVAFDSMQQLIFCSNGDGTVSVIRQVTADRYQVVQRILTRPRAKTLALDPQTHRIYLSVCDFEGGTKKIVPKSFRVLVYRPK